MELLVKPLSVTYQQFWLSRVAPVDWQLANVIPTYKKGWREGLGNCRPVSLTSRAGEAHGAA